MTLRVRDWTKHFEVNRTRELVSMTWLPIPNRQDGDGYTALLDHPNGAAHFGAWIALLEVASKCYPRGTLLRAIPHVGAGPLFEAIPHVGATPAQPEHDAASLSRVTRIAQTVFEEAIPRLLTIGWLEVIESRTSLRDSGLDGAPHEPATIQDITVQDSMGRGSAAKRKPRERFEAPTVDQVERFIEEQVAAGRRHYGKVNPARFVAYYDQIEWKVGRNPMKNWRAAVATWALREDR
jgi:hypothetical protein